MVGPQGKQISELHCDKFPTPQSFLVWKIRFQNPVTTCFDFPSDALADLFSVTSRDDNIREFDTRWDEVLLSMSKLPSDDILESL